jgi:thymidylate kinase
MITESLCLEGITGAGKTTQASLIRQEWNLMGKSYKIINEKEYEPFKQTIIDWHNSGANQNFSSKQVRTIAKARGKSHIIHFIPLVGNLNYLLFDRSFYTSAVYESDGELTAEQIINVNIQEGAIIPKRGVILICSPKVAIKRIDERRLRKNNYNLPSMHESLEEITKRRELYIELARQHPELSLIDTTNKTENEVFEEVRWRLRL